MTCLATMEKAPADVLDYDVDFSRWLPAGDFITAITRTISGGTATISASSYSNTTAKIWVSGGADGDKALVEVVATTNQGRSKKACFNIRIKECD